MECLPVKVYKEWIVKCQAIEAYALTENWPSVALDWTLNLVAYVAALAMPNSGVGNDGVGN